MRRLTNVEYNNSVRDLTGVDLQPAREFPADAAAGEGFTNVGDALVMSPSMLDKYLAAAKGIAAHAVFLPDGFRFSEKTTRPDWSEEILTEIKKLYREYTDPRGSTRVNLQGLDVGHQLRRTHPAREVPGRDHRAPRRVSHGQEVARGDRGRGSPEPEVPANPLGLPHDPGSPARPGSGPPEMARSPARKMSGSSPTRSAGGKEPSRGSRASATSNPGWRTSTRSRNHRRSASS